MLTKDETRRFNKDKGETKVDNSMIDPIVGVAVFSHYVTKEDKIVTNFELVNG